jgi:hypothetical protein
MLPNSIVRAMCSWQLHAGINKQSGGRAVEGSDFQVAEKTTRWVGCSETCVLCHSRKTLDRWRREEIRKLNLSFRELC